MPPDRYYDFTELSEILDSAQECLHCSAAKIAWMKINKTNMDIRTPRKWTYEYYCNDCLPPDLAVLWALQQ